MPMSSPQITRILGFDFGLPDLALAVFGLSLFAMSFSLQFVGAVLAKTRATRMGLALNNIPLCRRSLSWARATANREAITDSSVSMQRRMDHANGCLLEIWATTSTGR